SGELPEYMVPAYLVPMEKFPLTSNGKVNLAALPAPGPIAPRDQYIAPRDEIEENITQLWEEILGIEKNKIGIDHRFFQLGGNSLKATRFVSRLQKEMNIRLPLEELFKQPHIRGLSGYIKSLDPAKRSAIPAVETKEYYPLSPQQQQLYILFQLAPESTVYNLPTVVELKGQPNHQRFREIFDALVKRHESLRTSFETINNEPAQRVREARPLNILFPVPGNRHQDAVEKEIDQLV
ncbi:MAG: hypothetical protein GY940_35815, partial [bacterium]|nr:hypothetical protein [bacterium]